MRLKFDRLGDVLPGLWHVQEYKEVEKKYECVQDHNCLDVDFKYLKSRLKKPSNRSAKQNI